MNQEYLYGVSLLTSKKNWYFKHLLNRERERGFTVLDRCWLLLIKLIWFDYLTNYDLDGYLISINTHNQYGMQIKCKNIKDTSIWLWRKILTKKKKPSKGYIDSPPTEESTSKNEVWNIELPNISPSRAAHNPTIKLAIILYSLTERWKKSQEIYYIYFKKIYNY